LSDHERAEREEFTVEALYFMRDRFNQSEVWMRSGLPVEELNKFAYESGAMQNFRSRLFTRIVPILKEIGLFGPKVQKALGDMGVMEYAKIDVEKLIGNDMKVAEDFDAKKFVNNAIAAE
ncbi:MAG TPA: aminobenzoate oxygenase, partial [Stellaceae bacterium]|nr:aminobenzoate oxygenase [Stellaceae bacterium]